MTFDTLEWLRPLWLLSIVPLLFIWWWVIRRIMGSSDWESWVDAELQPHVLSAKSPSSSIGAHVLFLTWLICVVVLAGPVWEKQPVPVFESRPSMVAVIDVSPSMNLDDLRPSRMERAVYKLSDFLNQSKGIDLGLLVFAERPYIVSPLTDDVNTLKAFLPSITTGLAPVSGSQLNLAIDKAVDLLQQAGKANGQIVLLTDSTIGERDIESAKAAFDKGYQVSVIGVGTKNGAPLKNVDGGFVRSESGAVIVPKVEISELRKLAQAGGGISTLITRSASDINAVLELSNAADFDNPEAVEQDQTSDYWVEYGVWALPFMMLLALGLFRRGIII